MKSDIVIVGGGIIGLYSAYLLALRGIKSTLIDKGDFGKESTWAAGGILTPLLPWDYSEKILFLTRNASGIYQNLAAKLLQDTNYDIEHWVCGLTVFSNKTAQIKDWCNQNNVHYKKENNHLSQVHLTDIAQIRTPILIKALIKQLENLGVTLLNNTSVTQCCIEHNKIIGIETSTGLINTSKLIWATGAWASKISPVNVQLCTPVIEPIKGQMIALENCPVQLSSILFKNGHYLIPRKDGLILAGSTLENVGFVNSVTDLAKETLWKRSVDMMPELATSNITHHWAGLRPGSKDNIPTIGPHPDIEGLFYNIGHFRYGIAMAPKSCEILTKWIINDGRDLSEQEKFYSRFN